VIFIGLRNVRARGPRPVTTAPNRSMMATCSWIWRHLLCPRTPARNDHAPRRFDVRSEPTTINEK